jgi:hypothetical protein
VTSCSFLGKVGEFLSACMASHHIRQCYLSDVSCRMFTAHILQTDRQTDKKDESKQILYVSIKPAQTYVRKWVTVSKHESPNCCLRSDVSRYVLDIQRRYKQAYMCIYIYIYMLVTNTKSWRVQLHKLVQTVKIMACVPRVLTSNLGQDIC